MVKLKNAKEALRESEERYRLLFETSHDAIMTLEPPSWNFTSGNPATFEMFGVKDEEMFVSMPPWMHSPKFQLDGQPSENKAKKMIDIAMKKGSNFFEWTHKKQNGRDFFCSVLLTRMSIGEKTFLQATVRDITERKKAAEELKKHREHLEDMVESRTAELKKTNEQLKSEISKRGEIEKRIRESEKRFRQVVGNARELIWEVDAQGLYTYTSPAIEKILGYKHEEIVGKKHFYDLFHPEDREALKKSAFEVFAKRKSFSEFMNRNISKNGKTVWLSTSGIPILDKKRELLGYRGADTTITEYKQIEKMLKDTAAKLREQKLALEQKNIALSEIIAQVEVEKRNMKNDIAANVNELVFPILEKLKLEKTAGKYVDLLKTHLEELVSSFGRKIRGKRLNLTPREIEICNMIKGRLTSKEIAELLNISLQTVEKHRKNIRHKMGISKKDINLTSFLQTI